MKTWKQLSKDEKQRALKYCQNDVLRWIIDGPGALGFNDPLAAEVYGDCVKEMERLQTPWFLAEAVMENTVCKVDIEKQAKNLAKDVLWTEQTDPPVFPLPPK